MPEARTGFFEQKSGSPGKFGLVVLGHAALIIAVIMIKGPAFTRPFNPPTKVDLIPIEADPPPEQRPQIPEQQQELRFTQPVREFEIPTETGPTGMTSEIEPGEIPDLPGAGEIELARVEPPPPVRRDAQILSANLQPPYPAAEQRAERDGFVRLRVQIGTDGRVKAVERMAATSEAFWAATRRHALARWRFRPATEDGRPVESSKVMTVSFRIEDL
jgi:periplasmic protein TonB